MLAVTLFVLGAIFALGLWTNLAGPVGSALADGTSAALGRARVAVPVACFVFGVLLLWPTGAGLRRPADPDATGDAARSDDEGRVAGERPTLRIAIGVALLFIADVGILHLAYGQPSLNGALDDLRAAGGAFGAAVASPLVAATGTVGASLILAGIAVVGLLLVLGLSIGALVALSLAGARRSVVWARSKVKVAPIGEGVDLDAPDEAQGAAPLPSGPAPFDYEYDGIGAQAAAEPEPDPSQNQSQSQRSKSRWWRTPSWRCRPPGRANSSSSSSATTWLPRQSGWKLPPANLLKRGSGKEADRRLVDEGGRTLEATLAHHGVDARLVGATVGPTVTRYELELGPGREGQPHRGPQPRHPVRHGVARRAHPGADPRPQRGRRRGAEQGTRDRDPRRRPRRARGGEDHRASRRRPRSRLLRAGR